MLTIQEVLKQIYGLELKIAKPKSGQNIAESTEALLALYKTYRDMTSAQYDFCGHCGLGVVSCICSQVDQFFENCQELPRRSDNGKVRVCKSYRR